MPSMYIYISPSHNTKKTWTYNEASKLVQKAARSKSPCDLDHRQKTDNRDRDKHSQITGPATFGLFTIQLSFHFCRMTLNIKF